jgi:hypothetical protein
MDQRCVECNGTGGCNACKGSGKRGYTGRGSPADQSACPTCYATGVCQVCGGTGGASGGGRAEPLLGSSKEVRRA